MENLSVSELKDEIGRLEIKNHRFSFNDHTIRITTHPYLDDFLGQLLLLICSCVFLYDVSYLFISLIFWLVSLYFFYIHFIGLGICHINLKTKKIVLKNRIFVFNIFRKLFGIKTNLDFNEITDIDYLEGPLLNRATGADWNTRYYVLLHTHKNPGVIISQFKTEAGAKSIVSFLNKIIINKKL